MIEGLEEFTSDQLIAELINRQSFAGVVVWYTANVKNLNAPLEHGEVKITKGPPLTQEGTAQLLQSGLEMLPGMFGEVP